MPFKPPETAKCPKCQKSVYAAEEKVAGGHKWHKGCFKCEMCNKMLDSTNCAPHEDKLFCKNCHGRKYGPKGYGFGGGAGALSMDTGAQFGNTDSAMSDEAPTPKAPTTVKVIPAPPGEGCPRCGGFVYAAEQMLAKGRPWHKHCFKCRVCTKQLDSTLHNDGPDSEVYCKLCYSKKFGPKGYGFGGGAGALQSDVVNGEQRAEFVRPSKNLEASIKAPAGEGCPRCGGMVYAAEQMLAKGSVWHKKCFNCNSCRKPLDSINACDGPDKEIYCRTCYGKKFGPKGYGFGGGAGFLQTDVIQNEESVDMMSGQPRWIPPEAMNTAAIKGSSEQNCPRCGGAVFAAEQMLAKGSVWHKKCFNCKECHRPLDSINACDAPGREVFCKPCYGKNYGPKGFGYGSTPTLVSGTEGVSAAPIEGGNVFAGGPKAPPGEGCPRCGYAVYSAEMMISHGRSWHKRCFNCAECHKSLDSTNLCDGADKEIYCKGHYQSKFGIKGVGYGMGAGVLSMN